MCVYIYSERGIWIRGERESGGLRVYVFTFSLLQTLIFTSDDKKPPVCFSCVMCPQIIYPSILSLRLVTVLAQSTEFFISRWWIAHYIN